MADEKNKGNNEETKLPDYIEDIEFVKNKETKEKVYFQNINEQNKKEILKEANQILEESKKLESILILEEVNEYKEKKIKEELENYKAALKDSKSNHFEKKKALKQKEKELFEDIYSVEIQMKEKFEEEVKKFNELKSKSKKASKYTIEELHEINADLMHYGKRIEGGLDVYIQDQAHENIELYKEKFPEAYNNIQERKDKVNIAAMLPDMVVPPSANEKEYREQYKNSGQKALDEALNNIEIEKGKIAEVFNAKHPKAKQEAMDKWKKSRSIKDNQKETSVWGHALTALGAVGFVANPVGSLAVKGTMAIMNTAPMKKVRENLAKEAGKGLDRIGIKKDSLLRKSLRVAVVTATTGSLMVLAAAGGDLEMTADLMKEIGSSIGDTVGLENLNANDNLKALQDLGQAKAEVAAQQAGELLEKGKELITNATDTDALQAEVEKQTPVVEKPEVVATEPATPEEIANTLETSGVENIEPEMQTHKIVEGESLSAILETIDGKEFDLQGHSLNQAAALIADINGLSNPNEIINGNSIQVPKDTAALKELMEVNADRIASLDMSWTEQSFDKSLPNHDGLINPEVDPSPEMLAIQEKIEGLTTVESLSDVASQDLVSSNEGLNSVLSDFRNPDDLKAAINEKLSASIESQIERNEFPTAISLDIQSENSSKVETVTFSKEALVAATSTAENIQQQKVELLTAEYSKLAENQIAQTVVTNDSDIELPASNVENEVKQIGRASCRERVCMFV